MCLTINFTEEENRLLNSYAKVHSTSVSDAIKKIVLEKIEISFDGAYLYAKVIPNCPTVANIPANIKYINCIIPIGLYTAIINGAITIKEKVEK